MTSLFYTVLIALQISLIVSANTKSSSPLGFNKCDIADSACITKQVQAKLPSVTADVVNELNSKAFDPLILDVAEFEFGGMKINFYKAVLKNFTGFVVEKFEIDTESRQMRITSHTDALVRGRYSVNGNVLGYDINENGDAEINTQNFQISFVMPFEVVKDSRGRDVFELKGYKYSYDVKDKVEYHLSNLFPQNKDFSKAAHVFLNKNWKVVMTTYGKPVMDLAASKIFNTIRAYLLTQPIDEIIY